MSAATGRSRRALQSELAHGESWAGYATFLSPSFPICHLAGGGGSRVAVGWVGVAMWGLPGKHCTEVRRSSHRPIADWPVITLARLLDPDPHCPTGPAPRRTEEEQRKTQAGALDPEEEVEADRGG